MYRTLTVRSMVDGGTGGTCKAGQAGPKEFIASNCQMWFTKRIDLREPFSTLQFTTSDDPLDPNRPIAQNSSTQWYYWI